MVHKWFHDYAFTIHGKQHEYKKELKVNITFIIGIVRDKNKTLYHWEYRLLNLFYCHLSKGEFYNLFYARNLSHTTTIIDKTYIKSEATISYRRGLRKTSYFIKNLFINVLIFLITNRVSVQRLNILLAIHKPAQIFTI